MLAKYNIKSVAIPHRKIASYLPPVKDGIGLKTPGVQRIPCECGTVYIGQSGRSIDLRINPLAYTDVCETAGLARSINTQRAVRRNSETNPTSQHNRGMY